MLPEIELTITIEELLIISFFFNKVEIIEKIEIIFMLKDLTSSSVE